MLHEFPCLAMLAYTPHGNPGQTLVVRPHAADPDPAQLAAAAAADAAGAPAEASRITALANAEARNRSTCLTIRPEPDTEPFNLSDKHALRPEPDDLAMLEHLPLPLAQLMSKHPIGTLQAWVEALTTGDPCPDTDPMWFTLLMPRVHLREWHAIGRQVDAELVLRSEQTRHAPYGLLPDNVLGVRCKFIVYPTRDLPPPSPQHDA